MAFSIGIFTRAPFFVTPAKELVSQLFSRPRFHSLVAPEEAGIQCFNGLSSLSTTRIRVPERRNPGKTGELPAYGMFCELTTSSIDGKNDIRVGVRNQYVFSVLIILSLFVKQGMKPGEIIHGSR